MGRHRHLAALVLALAVAAAACAPGADQTRSTGASAPPTTAATDAPSLVTSATTLPPTTTTLPPTTVAATPLPTAALEPRPIWLFPGPNHYEGDVLSAQIPLGDFDEHELGTVTVEIDGQPIDNEAYLSSDPLLGGYVTVTDVYDTAGNVGVHTLVVAADIDGEPFEVSTSFDVSPATALPAQERNAVWASLDTECCLVHYLEDTAADRDLDELREVIEESAAEVEAVFETTIPNMEIVLLDVLWGNGGYAGGELVISYLDRDFGPTTGDTVAMTFVHELAHGATRGLDGNAPWPLDEAVAVYVAGGHFKPENVPARAAALAAQGDILPLAEFLDQFRTLQHETRYVQAGALAAFLVETYGWEAFLDMYTTDIPEAVVSEWFDAAAGEALGAGIDELNDGFEDWLSGIDPVAEGRDLELTIALQESRRRYQAQYAPYQNFFVYDSVLDAGSTSVALREARSPAFVAVEALISWAQHLIVDNRLDEAEAAIDEIAQIVETGTVDSPYASRVLAVSLALHEEGYELLSIDLDGDTAAVVATNRHPVVAEFIAELDGGDVILIGPVVETE